MVKWQILSIHWNVAADTIKRYIKDAQGNLKNKISTARTRHTGQRRLDDF